MTANANRDKASPKNAELIIGLSPEFLSCLNEAMNLGRLDEVRQLTKILHHADLADLL